MDKDLKAALDALGMTQTQAIEAQQKAHKEFTETVNADATKRDAVHDAKIEKLQAALDRFEPVSAAVAKIESQAKADAEARAAEAEKLQERLDKFEVELKRPPAPSDDN